MEIVKSIKEYERELKSQKKKFDKLSKQLKKCYSAYQYEVMYADVEDLHQDITELQLVIRDLRRKEQKERELEELYVD
jgi:septal ring factor EnvC (AmiA/AmiB activator)